MPVYWGTQKIGEIHTENHERIWVDINSMYPIGSIYMSTTNADPNILFGGTWTRIQDTFLLCAGSSYNAGSTGGSATTTLTTENLPSHTHSIGAHAHGLNNHTHTYDKSNSSTGGPSTNTSGATTLTVSQIPSHYHSENPNLVTWVDPSKGQFVHVTDASYKDDVYVNAQPRNTGSTGGGGSHTHTLSSHTHTNSYTSTNSGVSNENTTNSTTFDSGATGSGVAYNNMPPYLAVYVWQRIA